MFWDPFFEGRDKILLLGEALKFAVIFQKFAFKLLKYEHYGKHFRKIANFLKNFIFARGVEKNKNYSIHRL